MHCDEIVISDAILRRVNLEMTLLTVNRNFAPCPRFCHLGRIASPVPGLIHRAVAASGHHADAGYHRGLRCVADGDALEPGADTIPR